jgi:hypothetical protein
MRKPRSGKVRPGTEVGEIAFISEKGAEVREAIVADPVELFRRVANRWLAACVYYQPPYLEYQARLGKGWPIFLKRLIFPLPLLGLLVILWRAPVPMPAPIAAAIAIYALVLLPYALVSYYDRYATPLVGMKMLIVLHALALLVRKPTKCVFDISD